MVKLKKETLEWSLKHCRDHSFNFIPTSFEYERIEEFLDDIITGLNDLSRWQTNPIRKFLVPKDRFGFRTITELDPLDHLIYAGIIYEIGKDIESARPPIVNKTVFSYRFNPNSNGSIYDNNCTYINFLEHSADMANDFDFVAVTDISDFYSNIYHHRLDNNLRHITSKKAHVKVIMNLLSQWNERVSSGIPIGPIVSQILGEATLIDIDELLKLESVTYCRWNDDFRIFADSYEEAYEYLFKLSNNLRESHNLALQSSKTSILKSENFIEKYIHSEEREPILELEKNLGIVFVLQDGDYVLIEDSNLPEDVIKEIKTEAIPNDIINILIDESLDYEPNLMLIRYLTNRLIRLTSVNYVKEYFKNSNLLEMIPELLVEEDFSEEKNREIKNDYVSSELGMLLSKEVQSNEPNLKFIRYLINYLNSLNDYAHIEILLDNICKIYPLIPEIMQYIIKSDLNSNDLHLITDRLIEIYHMPLVETIDFARLWILHFFTLNPSFIELNSLNKMYDDNNFVKREIMHIMGKKGVYSWIRSKKRDWQNFNPWVRRAYLTASHCLPDDEKKHYHRSIQNRLGLLEKCMI